MQNCKTKREVIKMVLDGQKPPYVPLVFQIHAGAQRTTAKSTTV